MAPVSVLLAAWFGHAFGPTAFFLFAAVTIAAAVLGGLTQRAWRDFGTVPLEKRALHVGRVAVLGDGGDAPGGDAEDDGVVVVVGRSVARD
jgi:hypothetical protein